MNQIKTTRPKRGRDCGNGRCSGRGGKQSRPNAGKQPKLMWPSAARRAKWPGMQPARPLQKINFYVYSILCDPLYFPHQPFPLDHLGFGIKLDLLHVCISWLGFPSMPTVHPSSCLRDPLRIMWGLYTSSRRSRMVLSLVASHSCSTSDSGRTC